MTQNPGNHLIAELYECDAELINNRKFVEQIDLFKIDKGVDPLKDFNPARASELTDLKYYTPEIHKTAFVFHAESVII